MASSLKNASERIADWLVEHGVEQVFAVTGGGAMFLNHALANHPGLHCTFMHHEQACAMAAEGYARIAGKPALVNVTTGPGGINALNGVFGAFTDSIPMIAISGQVKRETWLASNPVPGLRQLGDQEAPIVEMVRPISKAAFNIRSLADLGELLPAAFRLATTGRPGPVWLDIPIDLQSSREVFAFAADPLDTLRAGVKALDVAAVIELMRGAHRPLILAGTGVRLAGAEAALLELVEYLGVPLATAWTHDLIASDHPLFAGRPGTIGTRAGNICLQAADLVIVIGSRLNIRQVSYNWSSFANRARVVQVDIDPFELNKPFVQPHLPIVADAAEFIGALRRAATDGGSHMPTFTPWIEWCQKVRLSYPAFEASNVSSKAINPYSAVARVFDALPDRAVVACGNASACILPFQVGHLRSGQRLFSNSGSASMGYELPAAIGAAIADPTRRVVCMAGDGSLQMNVQELQTLATLQLNVAVVVLANDGYLSIRLSHENFFGKVVGSDRKSGVRCPDYTALARAYQVPSLDIRDPMELSRLPAALETVGPFLIQIHVDPLQGFSPKLTSRIDETGRFLTPELDDMFPFLPPEELDSIRASAEKIRCRPPL